MRLLLALLFIVIAIAPVRAADTCNAGYYLNEVGECEICPAGYYCPGDDTYYYCNIQMDIESLGVEFTVGASTPEQCVTTLKPGYYARCVTDSITVSECLDDAYCPGGESFSGIDDFPSCDDYFGSEIGMESCGWGYTNGPGADSIDDCIPCPEFNLPWFGARSRVSFLSDGVGTERCKVVYLYSNTDDLSDLGSAQNLLFAAVFGDYAATEDNPNWSPDETLGGHALLFTYDHTTGGYTNIVGYNGTCPTGYVPAPGSVYDNSGQNPGVFANTVPDVLDALCFASSEIPDGTICGDLYGDGVIQCMTCADGFGSPLFTHSDGTRSQPTDCYAISNPGYYIQTNMDTYEVYESECVPGDYCPGGIDVRYDMATNSFFGGNISCATLGDEYTMSDAGATSENMCYKKCSASEILPEIENGTVVSDSNAFYPNACGYSIKCNNEYGLINNACYAICNSGISHMRTSAGNSFTLFAERVTSPSLNISYNNTVCYLPLVSGRASNTIHVKYGDTIYHVE